MCSAISGERVVIFNSYGEKLVGVLHGTESREIVILCHGFRSTKEDKTVLCLVGELVKKGISAFHFDFSGNGESEGPSQFQFSGYWKQVNDLRAVVLYLSTQKYAVGAVLGHSKGGCVALLYASLHRDVQLIMSISGGFHLDRAIEGRLGKGFMQRIKKDGFIDVMGSKGKVVYRVDEVSLMNMLTTNMLAAACNSISEECRVLIVHGSGDEGIPLEDAYELAKNVSNHKLRIIEGANHNYVEHQADLASVVLEFLASSGKFSCDIGDRNMPSKL